MFYPSMFYWKLGFHIIKSGWLLWFSVDLLELINVMSILILSMSESSLQLNIAPWTICLNKSLRFDNFWNQNIEKQKSQSISWNGNLFLNEIKITKRKHKVWLLKNLREIFVTSDNLNCTFIFICCPPKNPINLILWKWNGALRIRNLWSLNTLCICLKIFDIIMNYFHHATFMKLHLYTANHYMYILYNACKNSYQENSQVNHAIYS